MRVVELHAMKSMLGAGMIVQGAWASVRVEKARDIV